MDYVDISLTFSPVNCMVLGLLQRPGTNPLQSKKGNCWGPRVWLNLILTKRPQIKLTSGYRTHMCSETKESWPTCKPQSRVNSHLYVKVPARRETPHNWQEVKGLQDCSLHPFKSFESSYWFSGTINTACSLDL